MQEEKSKLYCPAIYHHLYVERVSADKIKVAPCCAAMAQLSDNSFDFDLNPTLLKIRQENSQGIASKECNWCWSTEKAGANSVRNGLVQYYSTLASGPGLHKLYWNVEPICNAKCIHCGSYNSSAWLAEDQKFVSDSHPDFLIHRTASSSRSNVNVLDKIDMQNLQELYFNGGEPLLSKDPEILLEKLQNIGRLQCVDVSFHTNGSVMPSKKLQSLLKKTKSTTVYFSIDGIHDQFYYIRNPIQWNELLANISAILDLGINRSAMATSVGVHNVLLGPELNAWWLDFTKPWAQGTKFFQTYQRVVDNDLALSFVSEPMKHALLEEIDQQPPVDWTAEAQHHLLQANGNDPWLSWLQKLDQRRNLNWQTYLPQLQKVAARAGIIKI